MPLIVAALLLAGCGGGSGGGNKNGTTTNKRKFSIGPIGYTAKNLAAESKFINTKFFWAGPQQGYSYEFTRTRQSWIYVRYLPPGAKVGVKSKQYLVVATYPFKRAYDALKTQAGKKAISGADGRIIFIRPNDANSVLVAFPNQNDQVEIYSPKPATALATAKSAKLVPVA